MEYCVFGTDGFGYDPSDPRRRLGESLVVIKGGGEIAPGDEEGSAPSAGILPRPGQEDFAAWVLANVEQAMAVGDLQIYLQPKIDLQKTMVSSAEALMRWHREDGSTLLPMDFLPILEEHGWMEALDFCGLKQALVFLKDVLDKGEFPIPISVNFSGQYMEKGEFAQRILALRKEYGIPAWLLEVELSQESLLMQKEKIREPVEKLREAGIRVVMDDFGKGYASPYLLTEFPSDIIKIDQELVSKIEEAKLRNPVMSHIITMLRELGFVVIAEGVEDAACARAFRELGCHLGQGYYFAQPMPVRDFAAFCDGFDGRAWEWGL